jgi:plastocyanin
MNTKLVIGGVVTILVLGGIYSMSQPEEAVAPMTTVEQGTQSNNSDAAESIGVQPTGSDASSTNSAGSGQGASTQTKAVSSKPATTVTTPPAPFIATVYYDGSGFVPETVTIVQGGTVQFENVSDRPMWVGSNNHPDHSRYPVKSATDCLGSSFDQCKSVGKGGTWSYTFSELGDWRYHNHVRSVDEGKVIVLTKEKYLKFQEAIQ